MNNIAIIPLFPLLGFLFITLGKTFGVRKIAGWIATSSVFFSFAATLMAAFYLKGNAPLIQKLYTWFDIGSVAADISFRLDAISLIFCLVITFVGMLIHVYSIEFMKDDEDKSRFFSYMNLFVSAMLILVLADNLLLLYLGWEGVGLCSYLLIGFWHREPSNTLAANKAFIITRVGDTFMIIGIFLLFLHFGTFRIEDLMHGVKNEWKPDSALPVIASLLILGGALGKSAQLPLQTWLPDAMAGPSPVSALIHAATMVTAGVYLIARMHILFSHAVVIQSLIAIIGALTLLIAGISAFTQHDLKRVLAYSTISQIGYMFLALGVGAWTAALFHFMIHAFFKALLFLAAGEVIQAVHEEHDMFKMGGLRKKLPVAFLTFIVGGASLSALPLLTAGFFSKDEILFLSISSAKGSIWLWTAGIAGAFITSLYTFRMIFITFYGELKTKPKEGENLLMTIPLAVLAVLSIIGGYIELPENLGHFRAFSDFLQPLFPETPIKNHAPPEWLLQITSAVLSLSGLYVAYLIFYKRRAENVHAKSHQFWSIFFRNGWGFDNVYRKVFIEPYITIARLNKKDIVDKVYNYIGRITEYMNVLTSATQNGKLRWYTAVLSGGIVVILIIMLML